MNMQHETSPLCLMKQIIEHRHAYQHNQPHTYNEETQDERHIEGVKRRLIIIPFPRFGDEMLDAVIRSSGYRH